MVPSKRKDYAKKGLKLRTRKQERAAPPKVSVYLALARFWLKWLVWSSYRYTQS